MADDDLRPIIIKKKKVISGGGHHGGAWKVAMTSLSLDSIACVFHAVHDPTPSLGHRLKRHSDGCGPVVWTTPPHWVRVLFGGKD
ncbi:hypothetical protein [Gymnodinialimonas sp. 57CJ19]|uniref:hypothetical protein n=1 Tax=Gymnodinialimonas sp. 57CJ19 TaxID=3138498 RepID=UPI003134608A